MILFLKARTTGDDRTLDLFGEPSGTLSSTTRVKGHVRSDGSYVREHMRHVKRAKPDMPAPRPISKTPTVAPTQARLEPVDAPPEPDRLSDEAAWAWVEQAVPDDLQFEVMDRFFDGDTRTKMELMRIARDIKVNNIHARRARAKTELLKRHGANPVGLEVRHPTTDQHAVILPDASHPGKFRASRFDTRGFYSHDTRDTAEQVLAELVEDGFTEHAPGALDRLASTDAWAEGMEATWGIQRANARPVEPRPDPERLKVYGWDAVKLSDAYSLKELDQLRLQVEDQHRNPTDTGGHPLEGGQPTIYLYDKAGRKKLDALAWAVRHKLDEQKRQATPAPSQPTPAVAPPSPPRPLPEVSPPTAPTQDAPQKIVRMTMDEWKKIHRDYKGTTHGQRTVMAAGRMYPVEIVTDPAMSSGRQPVEVEKPAEPEKALSETQRFNQAWAEARAKEPLTDWDRGLMAEWVRNDRPERGLNQRFSLLWTMLPKGEQAKVSAEAERLRVQHEDNARLHAKEKADRAALDQLVKTKLLAGESLTDQEIQDIGLRVRGSEFGYLSPVVQRLFGISKMKVREAMGDALKRGWTDMGAEIWSANPRKALANAAAWYTRKAASVAPKPRGLPANINVDGVMRPTANSDGKPIHPTEEGVRNFWKWFGDSKVVDDGGRPMVVHHLGSPFAEGQSVFEPGGDVLNNQRRDLPLSGTSVEMRSGATGYASGPGIWFGAKDGLEVGTREWNRAGGHSPEEPWSTGPATYSAYLALKNPLVITSNTQRLEWKNKLLPYPEGARGRDTGFRPDFPYRFDGNQRKQLVSLGYDGVILSIPDPAGDRDGREWIAFEPAQIKSAIGNTGSFSPTDPSIIKSMGTPLILFFKAQQRGTQGRVTDLFGVNPPLMEVLVPVKATIDRQGHPRKPHTRRVKVRMDGPEFSPKIALAPLTDSAVGSTFNRERGGTVQAPTAGGDPMKEQTPDPRGLDKPETYDNNPELATLARRLADAEFARRPTGSISRGDLKREFLSGQHAAEVGAALDAKAAEQAEQAAKATKAKTDAASIVAPPGYSVTVDGDIITVNGPFEQGLHDAIKRAGGHWNGAGRNWKLPTAKGSTLKRIMANLAKRHDPAAEEAKRAEKARGELERWLGYVEEKAPSGYLYRNGYDKLQELGISAHPDLKARLDAAVAKANAAKAEQERQRATAASLRSFDRATQPERQARVLYPVSSSPVLNRPTRLGDQVVVFTGFGQPFRINDDHPSMYGHHLLGHEGERGHYAYYRPATEQEKTTYAARAAEAQAKREADAKRAETLKAMAKQFRQYGERPGGPGSAALVVEGERLLDTQNIYGGGDWWVIQPDAIWYVQNNGSDGDDWSRNNVRTGGAGASGWRMPFDPDVADVLRTLDRGGVAEPKVLFLRPTEK